jgi:hypothetical protein
MTSLFKKLFSSESNYLTDEEIKALNEAQKSAYFEEAQRLKILKGILKAREDFK